MINRSLLSWYLTSLTMISKTVVSSLDEEREGKDHSNLVTEPDG